MAETLTDKISAQIPGVLEDLAARLAGLVRAELSSAVTKAQQATQEAIRDKEAVERELASLRAEVAAQRKALGKSA